LARKIKEFLSFLEAVVKKSKSENYIFKIILEMWNEKFFSRTNFKNETFKNDI